MPASMLDLMRVDFKVVSLVVKDVGVMKSGFGLRKVFFKVHVGFLRWVGVIVSDENAVVSDIVWIVRMGWCVVFLEGGWRRR